ncbi:MAG: TIM barrel protein [Acidobacteriaceae bacterium]|nr:TIM barrel protein [Acidobacteriaceae bacterium]
MRSPDAGKLQRIACNSWPFRAYFDTPEMREYRDPKDPLLTQAEFPEFLADHFAIHNVEFLSQHFADTEPATIEKVKAGLKKAGSRCCNLMDVHVPSGVFNRDADRKAIAKETARWVDVAVMLGSPSITIALTGEGPVDAHVAAGNLAEAVNAAHQRGIQVLFHNDDMKRESAETLVAVIQQLGRDRTGTCPDFGNFATKSAEYALSQLRLLAPYASNICHSKDGIAEKGKFYADDFPASMSVMRKADFRGVYSLEFEGLGNPLEGVHNLLELTERYMS